MIQSKTDRITKNLSKIVRNIGSPREAAVPRVTFGESIYNPGGIFGPRQQLYFQFLGVLDGHADIELKKQTLHIAAGEVGLLIPQGYELQRFAPKRKTHHLWCSVHPSLLPARLVEDCATVCKVLPMTRRMEQLMELGLSIPRAGGPRSDEILEMLGQTVLSEYLYTDECEQRHHHDAPEALRSVLQWIELMGVQPIDLAGLAKEAGISPSGLLKLFRKHLDTTPVHYLWKTRTRFGAQLLRETSLSVAEIAARSGFQSGEHFARLLHQHFGMSPRQFRAFAWGEKRPMPPAIASLPRQEPFKSKDVAAYLMAFVNQRNLRRTACSV